MGHKTKETYPTKPGSPTPCKQGLKGLTKPGGSGGGGGGGGVDGWVVGYLGYWVDFCWLCAVGLSEPLPLLGHFGKKRNL